MPITLAGLEAKIQFMMMGKEVRMSMEIIPFYLLSSIQESLWEFSSTMETPRYLKLSKAKKLLLLIS